MTTTLAHSTRSWRTRERRVPLGERTLVMGIVNVTPDSFSDGGQFFEPEAAIAHALQLERDGADLLDIGGESTRPGSQPVSEEVELERVVPVIRRLRDQARVPLSVDTRKAAVADAALQAGAHIVNDVSALADPAMAELAAATGAGVVLMHMQGQSQTMQRAPQYRNVVVEVRDFLAARAEAAQQAGVVRDAIAIDPGLGFGKRTGQGVEDNATLLARLTDLAGLGFPILVGPSRKTFLGNLAGGLPLDERREASLAAAAIAAWNGAHIVRAHDVAATRRALDVVDALRRERA